MTNVVHQRRQPHELSVFVLHLKPRREATCDVTGAQRVKKNDVRLLGEPLPRVWRYQDLDISVSPEML